MLPDVILSGGSSSEDGSSTRDAGRATLDALLDADHLVAWAASVGAVVHKVAVRRVFNAALRDSWILGTTLAACGLQGTYVNRTRYNKHACSDRRC